MKKPCNGRKSIVIGYSHGWSLITIRLNARILQLHCCCFPNKKKLRKMWFLSIFQSRSNAPTRNRASMSGGRAGTWCVAIAAAGGTNSAHTVPCSCSNERGVPVLGTAQLPTPPAALAVLHSTAQRRSQSATSRFQVTVVQKASLQQYMRFTPSCSFCQAVIFN